MRQVRNPVAWNWKQMTEQEIDASLYEVEGVPAYYYPNGFSPYSSPIKSPNTQIIINSRTRDALAHVSHQYKPIQTKEILTYTQHMLDEAQIQHKVVRVDNHAAYNNIMIALPSSNIEPQKGDVLEQYFIVRNHHGGMLNAMVNHFTKRLVCLNGATSTVQDLNLSVWHKGDTQRKIQDGLNIYLGNAIKAVEELYDWLGNTRFNRSNFDTYLNTQNILVGEYWQEQIKELVGNENTFFSLYQAFTNIITHSYGRTVTAKLNKFNMLNREVPKWSKQLGYDITVIPVTYDYIDYQEAA